MGETGVEPAGDHGAPAARWEATVPFIGFAEAYVLSAFRRAGVPLQRIRPAVQALSGTVGLEHALASEQLYTDAPRSSMTTRPNARSGAVTREEPIDEILDPCATMSGKRHPERNPWIDDDLGPPVSSAAARRRFSARSTGAGVTGAALGLQPGRGTIEGEGDLLELVVVRTGQHQFSELVLDYLTRITYGSDGWASRVDIAYDFDVPPDDVEDVIRAATRTAA